MLAVGPIPAFDTFLEEMSHKEKLEKMKGRIGSDHPMRKKLMD